MAVCLQDSGISILSRKDGLRAIPPDCGHSAGNLATAVDFKEYEMIYKRGDYGISVEQINGFGKNPGLWIHHGNTAIKMASFGSPEKAEKFIRYLDYLVLINGKEPNDDSSQD